ncbi:MAG: hypothetical protein SF053_21455 [Bacteroidia bacterium]|nr:hypothetical protein [Bacteroidia bacterium]
MQKLPWFLIVALLMGCSAAVEQDELPASQEEAMLASLKNFPAFTENDSIGTFALPDKSQVQVSEDGHVVTFVFPEGTVLMYKTLTGEIRYLNRLIYTCTCSVPGQGCDVFNLGNHWGCLQGNCKGSCTGQMEDDNTPSPDRVLDPSILENSVWINKKGEVNWVTSDEDMKNLMPFNPLMLEDPTVQQGVSFHKDMLAASIARNHKHTTATRTIAINVYGTLVGCKVPETFFQSMINRGYQLREVTCRCNVAGDGCTFTEYDGFLFCKGGGCSSCSMIEVTPPPKD